MTTWDWSGAECGGDWTCQVFWRCKLDMPADGGLGLPAGEGHTQRSLPACASKACIELLMLGFPITGARIDRIAGIESVESQRRQFILGALFSAYKALQVSFDGQALGFVCGPPGGCSLPGGAG